MNRKKNNKIIATGISTSLILSNMPYNVFANTEQVEEVMFDNLEIEENVFNEYLTTEDIALGDNYIKKEQSDEAVSNDLESEGIDFDEKLKIKGTDLIEKGGVAETSQVLQVETINKSGVTSVDKENMSIVRTITNYADSFAGGNGTQENPYQISNAMELARLAYLVNDEGLDTTGMYFELTADIDLSDFDSDDDDSNGNWIPIGYTTGGPSYLKVGFKGVFNGNGNTISNIAINTINSTSSGLFAYADNATIENLNINNVSINNGYNAGSLIGYVDTAININNVNVVDVSITNGGNVGGIVGYMYGELFTVENCSVISSDIIGSENSTNVGGLVGYMYGFVKILNVDINSNLHSDSYAGGLIGYYNTPFNGTPIFIIDNISITSDIESNSNGFQGAGLIAYCYISNVPEKMIISNIEYSGSIVTPENNSNAYSAGLISSFIGYDSYCTNTLDVSNIVVHLKDINGYSVGGLIANSTMGVASFDTIDISISGEVYATNRFGGLIAMSSSGSGFGFEVSNYNFKATNTIKANSNAGGLVGICETPISVYNAIIDFDLEPIDEDLITYYGGLIGYFNNYARDKNNIIENVHISMNATKDLTSQYSCTGGFFGWYFNNVANNISLYISNSSHTGDLYGNNVGGLIGYSVIEYELNIKNFYTIGDKKAKKIAGALIGWDGSRIEGTKINIQDIYVVGNIGSEIDESYLVTSSNVVDLNIINTYYDKTVYDVEDENLIGLTTEQMQGYPTYDNMDFDFDTVWKVNKEYYPTFEQLNTAPELFGEDIELILNQDYDLLDYVTVEDFEDKDLTIEIKETDLDITKLADYRATFTVADPKGLSDELTLNIKVVMESPIINANDLTIYVGDKFDPKEKVTAIDINGNDITEHIKVIENTVNTSKKGIYRVVYQVDSLEKLSTTKEIKVTVLEKENNNADDNNSNNSNGNSNAIEDDKNESSTNDKPQTGDNFVVYGISLLASLVGLFCINRKK